MSTTKKANLHNLEGREKTRKKKPRQTTHPPLTCVECGGASNDMIEEQVSPQGGTARADRSGRVSPIR